MESIWTKTIHCDHGIPLEQDLAVDVAIVGGGMAGILTAYLLKNSGLSVAVFEKGQIGQGKTGHTTAKLTSQHGMIYTKLIQQLGQKRARQYATTQQKAIRTYRQIIAQEHIDCDFSNRPAYLYSTQRIDLLKKETENALRLGLPASFSTETELPFPVLGAVHFENQAQFHPLKFLYSLTKGLTIYQYSAVTKIKDHTLTVHSPLGDFAVNAQHIVLTTGFPIKNVPGFYFLRQHQEISYLMALDHASPMDGMYYCADPEGYTFRSYDGLLLFGGLGHRTGKLHPGDPYRRLWHTARQWYPKAACVSHWSNEDCMPHDSLPFIGPFSLWLPHVYVATGFQKWGMTGSMTAATILADQILGRGDTACDLYHPQRMSLSGVGPFLTDAGHSILHLALQKPFAPRDKEKAIQKGFGPTCRHLGCTLSWNPADKTWDCPCHGSRYTEDGQLFAEPALPDRSPLFSNKNG